MREGIRSENESYHRMNHIGEPLKPGNEKYEEMTQITKGRI